jgi:hypothetical protein
MKKIIILLMATLTLGLQAEKLELDVGDCVLIKGNKLKNYLPKDKVEDFLSQPFNVDVVHEGKKYNMELQNANKKKRYKLYKVCVTKVKTRR